MSTPSNQSPIFFGGPGGVNRGTFDFNSSFQVPGITMKQPSASALAANKPMANVADAGGEDSDVNGEHLDELENKYVKWDLAEERWGKARRRHIRGHKRGLWTVTTRPARSNM
jgi:hypothetical protein